MCLSRNAWAQSAAVGLMGLYVIVPAFARSQITSTAYVEYNVARPLVYISFEQSACDLTFQAANDMRASNVSVVYQCSIE